MWLFLSPQMVDDVLMLREVLGNHIIVLKG